MRTSADPSASAGCVGTSNAERPGCLTGGVTRDCLPGRRLLGASSLAVSPDGAYLYSAAFAGNAVGVFKRVTRSR
jgi:hypothetical protein